MKKAILVITIALFTFIGKSYAEMSYGISGAITKIDATGTETEGGEKNTGSADNTVVIPSIFADFIPLTADVSDNTKQRSDTETSVTGTAAEVETSRTQKAQAELKNHLTLYANYNLTDTFFVKAGIAHVSLETKESLGTGSKYGNKDILGGVFGIGTQDGNHRFELTYTDYEDISLSSTVARTGVTTNNKIDADLDTVAFKYSYVF